MIIYSLLTQDLYSFTQQQAILHQFPFVDVEYEFKCRNDKDLVPYINEINAEIDNLCTLGFLDEELNYLRSISFLKPNYIEFLRGFRLQRDHVNVYVERGKLAITIKGNWFHTVLFEVPILAIVSEIYFNHYSEAELNNRRLHGKNRPLYSRVGMEKLRQKIQLVKDSPVRDHFRFADFGLRRRYSSWWHRAIIDSLVSQLPNNFIGTSNVYLAKMFNVKPIGTMSHQWLMCGQGLPNVRLSESQRYMLNAWATEYRGDLGIALSDTLGFDAFLKDFDLFFAKLYDGCRHDSGDPFVWCEKLIAHYEKLKIDPKTKTAVFSDGLTFPLALDLCEKFHKRINVSFGVGTNLTNDVGVEPLQNVIKLTKVNGNPVAKISDSPGKGMCHDDGFLTYLKTVFNLGAKEHE